MPPRTRLECPTRPRSLAWLTKKRYYSAVKQPAVLKSFLHFLRRVKEWNRPYLQALYRFWDVLSISAKLSVLMAGLILLMTTFFYGFAVYQTTREIKISAIHKGE